MIETARPPDPTQHDRPSPDPFGPPRPMHFREFCPVDTWSPAINLYRLHRRLVICVDLAGIEPGSIQIEVQTGRLILRGIRLAPQPPSRSRQTMCILSMEIDHGPFCRVIPLPRQRVDRVGFQIRYTRGLLWIRLPLLEPE